MTTRRRIRSTVSWTPEELAAERRLHPRVFHKEPPDTREDDDVSKLRDRVVLLESEIRIIWERYRHARMFLSTFVLPDPEDNAERLAILDGNWLLPGDPPVDGEIPSRNKFGDHAK